MDQSRQFKLSPEYLAREKRMADAISLKKPDRVPVSPLTLHFYPTKRKGISNKDAVFDMAQTHDAWKDAVLYHQWDAVSPTLPLLHIKLIEILDMTQIKWPGKDLPDNQPWQWVEGEYLKQDEYDEIMENPIRFSIGKLWPRISNTLAPLSGLLHTELPFLPVMSNAYILPPFLGGFLSQPGLPELLEKLLKLIKENEKHNTFAASFVKEITCLGYPVLWEAATYPAFDWISDTLRGMHGSMLDMYRNPEKLLKLVEMYTPFTIGNGIEMANQAQSKGVFIPMHRGADGFMSDKQFAKFYWPYLKALILGLIGAGYTPIPLFEGNYTSRLNYLAELPPGKIAGHFDHIDRIKAKEMIGDIMCFWGNVPASLLCTGSVQSVKDDVRELIDIFGDNGGLIIDGNMGIPDEAKPENVQAMMEAVFEYGVY